MIHCHPTLQASGPASGFRHGIRLPGTAAASGTAQGLSSGTAQGLTQHQVDHLLVGPFSNLGTVRTEPHINTCDLVDFTTARQHNQHDRTFSGNGAERRAPCSPRSAKRESWTKCAAPVASGWPT